MIKGIDVSDARGRIDWVAVKAAGIEFAIIRLGFGDDIASQDDTYFEENVAGCEANGIPWGAYIYSYAMSIDEAKSEAAHCLRKLQGKKPTYPVCFDMEDADGYKKKRGGLSKEMAVSICETFLDIMEDNGYYVCLYASLSWLNGLLNDSRLDRFDKWVAQWNTVCQYDKEYGLWQYGGSTNYIESPTVSGINGAVDKDYAYKDYPTIIKDAHLNGWGYNIIGALDEATKTMARGWAYNGIDDTPVTVHIYASKNGTDGVCIGGMVADQFREDLLHAGIGNGYHGYNIPINIITLGEGKYTIQAYGIVGDIVKQIGGVQYVTITNDDVVIPEPAPDLPTDNPEPETPSENPSENNVPNEEEKESNSILAALKHLLQLILKWITG